MAELKPVYLIWGDDETKIDAWRGRLRKRVADEAPSATLEISSVAADAEETVASIGALTLSVGRRYILVDGLQRWKASDVKQLAAALENLPVETIIVLLGRYDPKKKAKEQ